MAEEILNALAQVQDLKAFAQQARKYAGAPEAASASESAPPESATMTVPPAGTVPSA
jgi:hypothetical protein